MIRSTFGAFTTAKLAMTASQKGFQVTGQNIANINTTGYTRQRLDQMSLNIGNNSNQYSSEFSAGVGNGVLVTGLSQIRDPYLDRRFRTEISRVGEQDNKLSALEDLERIFDEVGKVDNGGGIHNQIGEVISMLQKLSNEIGNKEFDSMVKSSSEVLTKLFNQYSSQIDTLRKNLEGDLTDIEVPEVNSIMKSIAELNKSIKNAQIGGDSCLELIDQRNTLIDDLASYVNIDVKYKPIKISDGLTYDELSISLVDGDYTKEDYLLVNDEKYAEFDLQKVGDKWQVGLTVAPNDKKTTETISYGQDKNLTVDNVKFINDIIGNIKELNTRIDNGDNTQETADLLANYMNKLKKYNGITVQDSKHIYLDNPNNPSDTSKPHILIEENKTGILSNPVLDSDGNLKVDLNITTEAMGNYTYDKSKNLTSKDFEKINQTIASIQKLNEAMSKGDQTTETATKMNELLDVLRTYSPTITVTDRNKITMENPADATKPITLIENANGVNKTGVFGRAIVDADGNAKVSCVVTTSTPSSLTYNNFNNRTLKQINTLASQIYDLNKKIAETPASDTATLNSLKSQLDQSLNNLQAIKDKNSSYSGLQISGQGSGVGKVTFMSDGTSYPLVDGDITGSLTSLKTNEDGSFALKYSSTKFDTNLSQPNANNLLITGSLKSALEMLNCNGEFDATPNSPKGLGYYTKMLDSLASTFAKAMNTANDPNNVGGKDLFTSNDGNPITAGNISVVKDWPGITASTDATNPKQDNTNIEKMISMLNGDIKFEHPIPGNLDLFEGTFQECFVNIGDVLSLDIKSTKEMLTNYTSVAATISDSRDNVSGVSLDEEGMNLLQYQKSFTAAARLMTTLDEALDTLLNMGVVGR